MSKPLNIPPERKAKLRNERRDRAIKALVGNWPEEIIRQMLLLVIEDTFDTTTDRGHWQSLRWHIRSQYWHYKLCFNSWLDEFWHRSILRKSNWQMYKHHCEKFEDGEIDAEEFELLYGEKAPWPYGTSRRKGIANEET